VWYFVEDNRLSDKALETFEYTKKEGKIIVPAVVLAEIMFIARKQATILSFEETLGKIHGYRNFAVAALDVEILKLADRITEPLEMHDSLIVATALCLGVSLITKDKMIRKAGVVATVW
jgi:predicted nucleic acid-binding protein